MEPDTIRSALIEATGRLAPGSDSARLDAEILLAHVLRQPRTHLHAWPDKALDADTSKRYRELIDARQNGQPVAYLTGRREFWSLDLAVTSDTLIPRPETELLVECALSAIPEATPFTVVDLGTGSGAIALAIASERPQAHVIATDISDAALAVARDNARALGLDNITLIAGDWCAPLPGITADMIVSNPPYIPAEDPHLESGDVRHEPRLALAAGHDGMTAFRDITRAATRHLRPGGSLILEHGYDQRDALSGLLGEHGYQDIQVHDDPAGLARVMTAKRP